MLISSNPKSRLLGQPFAAVGPREVAYRHRATVDQGHLRVEAYPAEQVLPEHLLHDPQGLLPGVRRWCGGPLLGQGTTPRSDAGSARRDPHRCLSPKKLADDLYGQDLGV